MASRNFGPKANPPATASLKALTASAKTCTACHLYRLGTQTVFGEGLKTAKLMLVGEQPGDKEDLAGKPFVGPAGALLDEILLRAKIPREEVYVTNAVKHFKWIPRGKTRLHQKPNTLEIRACHPWLEAEVKIVKPTVIICLGATAAFSVFGKTTQLGANRGKIFRDTSLAPNVLVTWHPSAILRAPDPESRHRKEEELFEDLRLAWKIAKKEEK
jgi:uracil-DNA glycosylase family protein